MAGRGNFIALRGKKIFKRVKSNEWSLLMSVCEDIGEDLLHFMDLCPGLSKLRTYYIFHDLRSND